LNEQEDGHDDQHQMRGNEELKDVQKKEQENVDNQQQKVMVGGDQQNHFDCWSDFWLSLSNQNKKKVKTKTKTKATQNKKQ
jgi:hypothetical protein